MTHEPDTPVRTSGVWVVVHVFGVLVLALFVAASAIVTLFAWGRASDGCALGMEFERTSSEVIEHRSFPPREVCRYNYDSGVGGAPIYPPSVEEEDATPALLVTVISAAVLVLYATVLLRRASAHAKASALRKGEAAQVQPRA